MASYEWELRFDNTRVSNITTIGSDHCPIVVEIRRYSMANVGIQGGRWFYFEKSWAGYNECKEKIIDSWLTESDFHTNAVNCKNQLTQRSKRIFGEEKRKVAKLQETIRELRNETRLDDNVKKIRQAELELKVFCLVKNLIGG